MSSKLKGQRTLDQRPGKLIEQPLRARQATGPLAASQQLLEKFPVAPPLHAVSRYGTEISPSPISTVTDAVV